MTATAKAELLGTAEYQARLVRTHEDACERARDLFRSVLEQEWYVTGWNHGRWSER